MDWVSRLLGAGYATKKTPPKSYVNDPQVRLAKFKRVYHTILQLCNKPRNLTNEGPLLAQLQSCLDKVVVLIREEARAPAPHLCLQFVSANHVFTVCARAATVSRDEPIIQSTVALYAALVDSEEEDFLSSGPFAKSLIRLVRKVVESGTVLVNIEIETSILELLFTIAAKIRLQPEILSFWFQSTAKPELEDVFVKEKKSFVGITQKDDFPLCYLLIDRVHHEGRIGDFARTGLLYIFEATGRSAELEEWVVSSDLPTLMASGLGALYSQLSRELSILHPDVTLPPVLAMSDYSTTHPRATAESAFSDSHRGHMATFLSYLAFWQDVLDHCRSADVKQTLLDHFQILFLQQLLYPSLLQSSDTDAGSSVAVLTYMTAMLESLEYPDLIHMMLAYLLAVDADSSHEMPITIDKPPPSPTAVRRRQSLMLLTAPKDPNDAVEPSLFNLVDLILNNINSLNDQSVFAALKLASTLINRQKRFAFGTLLRVQSSRRSPITRTAGALDLEVEKFTEVAQALHPRCDLDDAYGGLVEDVRLVVEAQMPFASPDSRQTRQDGDAVGRYILPPVEYLLRALQSLLRTFFTNSVDLNLALTQTLISIAMCVELRMDGWLVIDPSRYEFEHAGFRPQRQWQVYIDGDENAALSSLHQASLRPVWSDDTAPMLYKTLEALASELDVVRKSVPDLHQLIMGRKHMLQSASIDAVPPTTTNPAPALPIPTQQSFLAVPQAKKAHSRSSSQSSLSRGRKANSGSPQPHASLAASSPVRNATNDTTSSTSSPVPPVKSIFLPPPPDAPNTTDVLMRQISFPPARDDAGDDDEAAEAGNGKTVSLNHVLTNVVVLQEFVLELVAVLQVRAAVLGELEVKLR